MQNGSRTSPAASHSVSYTILRCILSIEIRYLELQFEQPAEVGRALWADPTNRLWETLSMIFIIDNNRFYRFVVAALLDGEICFLSGTWCKLYSEHYYITLINVVHINKIYILTLYSGYFGKNPGILGSRIIKICANIKLNKVVYIKLQHKSVYQYFFT